MHTDPSATVRLHHHSITRLRSCLDRVVVCATAVYTATANVREADHSTVDASATSRDTAFATTCVRLHAPHDDVIDITDHETASPR